MLYISPTIQQQDFISGDFDPRSPYQGTKSTLNIEENSMCSAKLTKNYSQASMASVKLAKRGNVTTHFDKKIQIELD